MTPREAIIAEADAKFSALSDEIMSRKARRDADTRLQYLLGLARTIERQNIAHGVVGGRQVFRSIFIEPDHPRWLRAAALAGARINQLGGHRAGLALARAAVLRREEKQREGWMA